MYDILSNIQVYKEQLTASAAQWNEGENAESLFYEHFGFVCAVIHNSRRICQTSLPKYCAKAGLGFLPLAVETVT